MHVYQKNYRQACASESGRESYGEWINDRGSESLCARYSFWLQLLTNDMAKETEREKRWKESWTNQLFGTIDPHIFNSPFLWMI